VGALCDGCDHSLLALRGKEILLRYMWHENAGFDGCAVYADSIVASTFHSRIRTSSRVVRILVFIPSDIVRGSELTYNLDLG
jgi:hypothetical protein